jgi:hypothetical protein
VTFTVIDNGSEPVFQREVFGYTWNEVVHMGVRIRLKTGFFETKNYWIEIKKNQLCFLPENQGEGILQFDEKEILTVTLKDFHIAELELQTSESIYIGIFSNRIDLAEALELMKGTLATKIIYEYEGGN